MTKLLATCAAVAIAAVLALPAPAGAAERSAAGIEQTQSTDISAAKRKYRKHRRHYTHRYYYGPRYYSAPYYRGYGAYAYDPYYRPYYTRPGISVGVGPFGFGVW
jgi:hypothetical protein